MLPAQISGHRSPHRFSGFHNYLPLTAVGWAVVVGVLISVGGSLGLRGALLVSGLPLVVAVVGRSTRATLIGLVLWLVALGLIRRLVSSGTGATVSHDPLLLVGPAALGALFIVSVTRGAFRQRTPLAFCVFLLSLLALVEAFNPLQGGLTVGLGGLLFILVPMLAFWVGRSLVDDDLLRRVFRLVAVLSVLSAIYGLIQQFSGFPSWDQRWINSEGYTALNVSGVERAFGTFASSEEYTVFLGIGLVILVANIKGVRRSLIPLYLMAIGLVGSALFLDSSRGPVVLVVLALGAMVAARAGLRPGVGLFGGCLAVLLLGIALSHVSLASPTTASAQGNPAGALLQHEISGLSDPSNSTLSLHLSETVAGIGSAFALPIGHGTGSVTLAAGSLGGASEVGTEDDLGNAGRALGLPGLLLYLVIVVLGLMGTYRLAVRRRDSLALAAFGLLVVALFQWLNGGLYSVAWLCWLCLGWLDQQSRLRVPETMSLAKRDSLPYLRFNR